MFFVSSKLYLVHNPCTQLIQIIIYNQLTIYVISYHSNENI